MFQAAKNFFKATSETLTKLSGVSSASEEGSNKFLHRVKIVNLPPREMGTVKKLLLKFDIHKFKKAPKWDYAYLNFETEEAARSAMLKLNGVTFKKRVLSTEYNKVSDQIHRTRFEAKKKALEELPKEVDPRTPAERLADQVTPLHKVPYGEQIAKKHKLGFRYLNTLRKKVNTIPENSEEGKKQIAWTNSLDGMNCELLDIIQSTEINGYRTKCEFSIGKDLEGEPTVGFLLGLYKDGITAVLGPENCLHVKEESKKIAHAMENYIRRSKYQVYDRVNKIGVWRSIMTKTQRTGEVMILIQINTTSLSNEQVLAEKRDLIAYWDELKQKNEINTTTLMLQIWNGDSNGITNKGHTEILTGDGYIHENLLDCSFRISSSAFFQVNTPTTELLYAKCAEWCDFQDGKNTTLLDLCCGTGTIGITMAKSVDKVIGIEMIPEAIVDAKANALLNNVTNVEYYACKVEDKIDIVANEKNDNVIAILDPPRSGVHTSVIRAIRESKQINKVVYISCDPKQAMQNFIGLCRPTSKRFMGMPFKPSRAVSVDLFPHTDHCEMMIEFVRLKEEETATIDGGQDIDQL